MARTIHVHVSMVLDLVYTYIHGVYCLSMHSGCARYTGDNNNEIICFFLCCIRLIVWMLLSCDNEDRGKEQTFSILLMCTTSLFVQK